MSRKQRKDSHEADPIPTAETARPTEMSEPRVDWTPTRPSVGIDMRRTDRISQRELGRVSVSLRPAGGSWSSVRLWDFSSIGFGIVLEPTPDPTDPILARGSSTPGAGAPAGERASAAGSVERILNVGEDVELRIAIRTQEEFTVWCKVMNVGPWKGATKVGLRRLDINSAATVAADRRQGNRLALPPAVALKARIRHPFLFGHWSLLRVFDVNRDLGFSFKASDPSILLFEGMLLTVHFDLSSLQGMPMLARVVWVSATGADEVRFGVECLEMDWRLQEGICDLLLFSRNWTPRKLHEAGFRTQHVKGHLRFRTVKTMDDYAEVLHLRRDAYVGVGKRAAGTQPEEMATPLDGKSRILVARHHGRLVGSLTFTFPTHEEEILDSQAGFPGQKYPVHLPPKANLIEVSRLCIDESYRGTDLLIGLFEQGLKHFLLSDRHWLITSATDELLPMYKRIGFVQLKATYRHPKLNLQPHHLIVAHKSAFLWGFGIGLLTWNSVFGDLVENLLERKLLSLPGWIRAIIRVKLQFRPVARYFLDAKTRKAFRKHLRALRSRNGQSAPRKSAKGRAVAPSDGLVNGEGTLAVSGSLYEARELDAPEPRLTAGKP